MGCKLSSTVCSAQRKFPTIRKNNWEVGSKGWKTNRDPGIDHLPEALVLALGSTPPRLHPTAHFINTTRVKDPIYLRTNFSSFKFSKNLKLKSKTSIEQSSDETSS